MADRYCSGGVGVWRGGGQRLLNYLQHMPWSAWTSSSHNPSEWCPLWTDTDRQSERGRGGCEGRLRSLRPFDQPNRSIFFFFLFKVKINITAFSVSPGLNLTVNRRQIRWTWIKTKWNETKRRWEWKKMLWIRILMLLCLFWDQTSLT